MVHGSVVLAGKEISAAVSSNVILRAGTSSEVPTFTHNPISYPEITAAHENDGAPHVISGAAADLSR